MTIKLLKIFMMVYQLGSITKASLRLHMVQPAVSVAIKDIETYYGVKLFERVSHGMDPTPEARALYEYAMHLMEIYDEMENDLKHHAHMGTLRIGTTMTIGQHFLPGLMARLKKSYPDLKMQARISNTQSIEEAILNNQIDLALVEGKLSRPDYLVSYPFLEDQLVLICHPSHPLAQKGTCSLKEACQYPFLFREVGSSVREQVDHLFYDHDLVVEPILESASTQAILKAVDHELGLTILPWDLVKEVIEAGRFVKLELTDASLRRVAKVIHHKNKYLNQLLSEVIEICLEAGHIHH